MPLPEERPSDEQIASVYVQMIAGGICPECASIEGRNPRYQRVETVEHLHIAKPCGHLLWADWGFHRSGAVPMS